MTALSKSADASGLTVEPEFVTVRRQWNDWRQGKVKLVDLADLHWDWTSGGIQAPAPQPFIHGYVSCDKIEGEVAHSCLHGEGPHRIKVCLVKKDQSPGTWEVLLAIAGPKP